MWSAGRGKLAVKPLPSLRSRWDSRSTRCGDSREGGRSVVGRSGGMIERRSRQKDPDEESELCQQNVRAYTARKQEEMRAAWCEHQRTRRLVTEPSSRP